VKWQNFYSNGAKSFHQLAISSSSHFINWSFYQMIILYTIQSFHQLVISSFIQIIISIPCHLINEPSYGLILLHLGISSTNHIMNWTIHQLVFLFIGINDHFINSTFVHEQKRSFHWLVISSTVHIIDCSFHQLFKSSNGIFIVSLNAWAELE
jgi:hypothetical protein